MGIKDIFMPSWKNSDPQKRKIAIQEIEDKNILKKIIVSDGNNEVKKAAYEKIKQVIRIDELIKEVKNEKLLEFITFTETYPITVEAALRKITDPEVIEHIALAHKESHIRKKAIELIKNDDMLIKITTIDKDYEIRVQAVKQVTDISLLYDIILTDSDFEVRQTALLRYLKTDLLDEHAIAGIDNEKILKDLAGNAEDYTREKALEKISDQNFLVDFCRKERNGDLVLAAMKNIKDESFFQKAALNQNYSWSVREESIKRVNNIKLLYKISKDDHEFSVRKAALLAYYKVNDIDNELIDKINDEKHLADIVINGPNDHTQIAALKKIKDNNLIAKLAKEISTIEVKKAAIELINDQSILEELIRNEFNPDIVKAVEEKQSREIKKELNYLAIDIIFDELGNFSENLARIKIGNKWGYVDEAGEIVIRPAFSGAGDFCEGYSKVLINGKWAFIDKKGKFITKPLFDDAKDFSEGFAGVRIKGKWGFIKKP